MATSRSTRKNLLDMEGVGIGLTFLLLLGCVGALKPTGAIAMASCTISTGEPIDFRVFKGWSPEGLLVNLVSHYCRFSKVCAIN